MAISPKLLNEGERVVVSTRTHPRVLLPLVVEYESGPVGRMLGCGTLRISDAGTDGEVVLHDIPHVERVPRTLLQEERCADGV